jgi:hypothetical protein
MNFAAFQVQFKRISLRQKQYVLLIIIIIMTMCIEKRALTLCLHYLEEKDKETDMEVNICFMIFLSFGFVHKFCWTPRNR